MEFDGKVAIVTGGASGIGEAITNELAENGATVAIADLLEDVGRETARGLEARGFKARVFPVDVSDAAQVGAMVKSVVETYGGVDILVNNAVNSVAAPFLELSDEDWLNHINVKVMGYVRCSREVVPHMERRGGGRIINIGSEVVHLGITPFTAYVAAKGGQNGFNRSLAHELAPWNITVNMVAPGWIPVERHENDPQDLKDGYFASIPMQRWGKPEDLAGTIVYLASEASAFVTGQNIHVNGGVTVH